MPGELQNLLLTLLSKGEATEVRQVGRSGFPYRFPGVSVWKRGGRRAPSDPWLLSYRDPVTGKHRTETASSDTEITARAARVISKRLDMHRLGQLDARTEKIAEAQRRPLIGTEKSPGHLEDYRAWLIARGITSKQAKEVYSRAKKLIEACAFGRVTDVEAETVQLAVSDLRNENDWSLETCNKYLKSMKQFARWLARPGIRRAADSPLRDMELYNASTDPRHTRRALTITELEGLLKAAAAGPEYQGISGADRRRLYLVAAHTGFRKSELASLTPESFDLDAEPPTVTVQAACSKHRRTDVQRFRADVAEQLRPWLKEQPAGETVFKIPERAYLMIKADLAAAGIEYETAEGFADFHSLRHTFITILGQDPKNTMRTVQQLARHSDIRLTARYMHTRLHDEERALEGLPALPAPDEQRQAQVATGTYGAQRPAQASAQQMALRQAASEPPQRAVKKIEVPENVGVRRIIERRLVLGQLRPPKPKVIGSSPIGNASSGS